MKLLATAYCLLLAFEGFAGPVNSNSAFAPHTDESIWREKYSFLKLSGGSRELEVRQLESVYIYGFNEKLTGVISIPYVHKKLTLGMQTRQVSGLADIKTLVKYRIYTEDQLGKTHRLGVFIGMEWPTGNDNERDEFGRIPQPLQLGSGSIDPIAGLVWTTQTLGWELDADISYKMNTRSNAYEFGDLITYNFSYQHRIWPAELPESGVPSFLYGVLELNGSYAQKDENRGIENGNTGGHRLLLSPGVQWVTKSWVLEAAVQLPLLEDLNGGALNFDYAYTVGVRWRF